jgi:hypothetical protein
MGMFIRSAKHLNTAAQIDTVFEWGGLLPRKLASGTGASPGGPYQAPQQAAARQSGSKLPYSKVALQGWNEVARENVR